MFVPSTRPLAVSLVAVSALALGACGLNLRTAQHTTAPDAAFEAALHGGYLNLAQSEYDEADYYDSDAFAERAITLARGDAVAPEEIGARMLPEGSVAELSEARGRLVTALDDDAGSGIPEATARAQTMFDCWMQEQEENRQPHDIARCRSGFLAAMAAVESALAPAPPPPPVVEAPRLYAVLFDFDSAALTEAARNVIDAVLGDWGLKTETFAVTGHTDTAGPARYNQALSEARAENVRDALQEGGIRAARLTATGVGETGLAVPTADGVDEPGNRRVTVEVE